MKKNWFTLMEVMLSIILFSLMVWAILWSYNSVQRASIKTANTQDALQVAEDFLERINDMSLEYQIDTGKYSDDERFWHREIINTGALHLKNKNNWKENTFYRECSGTKCSLFMDDNGTKINLINNDKVNVTNLQFTIYPNDQYVNTDITAKVDGWESLYKSWITLSTTIGFKKYEIYGWEYTPEKLCEDICSIWDIGNSWLRDRYMDMRQNRNNNTTMSSCTLWYGFSMWYSFWDLFWWWKRASKSIYDIAQGCEDGTTANQQRCNYYCNINSWGTNPFNCWYIRKRLHDWVLSGITWCKNYDDYVWGNACQDMCLSSIFSCIKDNDDPLLKRTGILIETWEFAWYYLQNPKSEEIEITLPWQKPINIEWDRKCNSWTPTRYCYSSSWWSCRQYRYKCNNWNIFCSVDSSQSYQNITEDRYSDGCHKTQLVNKTWWKNIYYPEPQYENNGNNNCICQVSYTYSINAWWMIEAWTCWWLSTTWAKYVYSGGEDEEIFENNDYISKPSNLFYRRDNTIWWSLTESSDWDSITWLYSRAWISTVHICGDFDNDTCNNTDWTYINSYTTYHDCKCDNEDYYTCLEWTCCPNNWTKDYRYKYDTTCEYEPWTTTAERVYCENKLGWTYINLFIDRRCTNGSLPWRQTIYKYYCDYLWYIYNNSNNQCYKNTSTCWELLCIKNNNNDTKQRCTSEWWWERKTLKENTALFSWNDNSIHVCNWATFSTCIHWINTNIYKDYDYTCKFSIADQSNNILDIIYSIWSIWRTTQRSARSIRWWLR